MEESDIKKGLNKHLKDFEQFVDVAMLLRNKEKEKYLVGVQLQEAINLLRKVLPSLSQMENVRSARQDNIQFLRIVLVNLLDAGLTLEVLKKGESAVLRSQLMAQINAKEKKTDKEIDISGLSIGVGLKQSNAQVKGLLKGGNPSVSAKIKAIIDAEKSAAKKDKKRPVKVSKKR